jgi:ubiquitin-protein ligase
MAKDTVL